MRSIISFGGGSVAKAATGDSIDCVIVNDGQEDPDTSPCVIIVLCYSRKAPS
jgi:hypothetical protein